MDKRFFQLRDWLCEIGAAPDEITAAAGDASSRRYFRVRRGDRVHGDRIHGDRVHGDRVHGDRVHGDHTAIAMDAPPPLDCRPFVAIAARLRALGLRVPDVLAADLDRGFLLLSDFGQRHFLDQLTQTPQRADALYADAFDALLTIQLDADPVDAGLPPYDDALLRRELGIFSEWLLEKYLRVDADDRERRALDDAFDALCRAALEQPRCWVHRDYHSRNLMVLGQGGPGILDFQDGLHGPVCYDPVSLLRDCYIDWPAAQVRRWALDYFERLRGNGFALPNDNATLLRWFDLTGAQRHLKAAGLFARLHLRDGKSGYLADLPRTLGYVVDVAERHAELAGLARLLRARAADLLR